MFPGNDAPVTGSTGVAFVQPEMPAPLKSPARSAAVGTNAARTVPRSSRFHSWEAKKCSLSLMMGPPSVHPKSFRFSFSLSLPACSRK